MPKKVTRVKKEKVLKNDPLLNALDVRGKIVFITGGDLNQAKLFSLAEKVQGFGGLGVVYLGEGKAQTWDSIYKAIDDLQAIVAKKAALEAAAEVAPRLESKKV